MLGRATVLPLVVALACHAQHPTHVVDREFLQASLDRDELEPHLFSLANQAAAFFRKALSICSRALSLRSFANSARSDNGNDSSSMPPCSFALFTQFFNVFS